MGATQGLEGSHDRSAGALRERLLRVLVFAVEHLPRLRAYAAKWPDDASEDVVRMQDKILAETAILLLVARRAIPPGAEGSNALAALTDLLETAAADRRNLSVLLRSPHNAPALGLPQVVLRQLGRGDAEMQQVIRRIFTEGLADALERIPYRAMEVRWIDGLLNPDRGLNTADLLGLNVLQKPVHPISMSRTTGYALTHGIMYATDFGAHPLTGLAQVERCAARIDAATSWVLVNEDLDLLIEFIIAATLLRRPWSTYSELAFRAFTQVWDELGFLPCPSFKPSEYLQLQDDSKQSYVFRHVYHTMYVAGLLCAILLTGCSVEGGCTTVPLSSPDIGRTCAEAAAKARAFSGKYWDSAGSEAEATVPTSPQAVVVRLTNLIQEIVPEHHSWVKAIRDEDEWGTARVLCDAAIIHAARLYDLPKLLTALNLAMDLPPGPSLTAAEGALFLTRQQLSDGCIGVQFIAPEMRRSAAAMETTSVVGECLGQYAARFSLCL